MVRGFLLNNELTDFDFVPGGANEIAPGKRPRSSMAPTIVFAPRTATVRLAVGSPGGPNIINYVAKALVAMLDWGLDAQAADRGAELRLAQRADPARSGHPLRGAESAGSRRAATRWKRIPLTSGCTRSSGCPAAGAAAPTRAAKAGARRGLASAQPLRDGGDAGRDIGATSIVIAARRRLERGELALEERRRACSGAAAFACARG